MTRVTVLVYSHRHGQDVSAYSCVVAAMEAAADLVELYIDEIPDPSARARIQSLIREKRYDDAIAAYNLVRYDDERIELHGVAVES